MRCQVVIVNWNSWEILVRCLDHLNRQSFREFAVMVIDNASTQAMPMDLQSLYPEVKFVANPTNQGFAAANNLAVKLSEKTEYIALLNPDAFAAENWLKTLIDCADRQTEFSMFASRQLMDLDPATLDGDGDAYHISGLVWREGHGRAVGKAKSSPREVFSPCAAAALYRREAFLEVGGFDEDYFCYVEDVDLGFRLRLRGHRCLLVPQAIVRHIGSATSGGRSSDFAVYHGHRNLVWTFFKNMPLPLLIVLLPMHILMNLTMLAIWTMQGNGRTIVRAKLDAAKDVGRVWSKRKEVQSVRSVSTLTLLKSLTVTR
jgi:GT2 family glycosyltransferase